MYVIIVYLGGKVWNSMRYSYFKQSKSKKQIKKYMYFKNFILLSKKSIWCESYIQWNYIDVSSF